jgi:ADP-heptose:LPS heptosyltransferase
MLRSLLKGRAETDTEILRLRPENGFGDHLMLSAVIEGIRAEHPSLRIHIAASHPEIFHHNPHVEHLCDAGRLKKWRRDEWAAYILAEFRPPVERHMQVEGHLIDDMYARVGVPVSSKPRRPRIYLTERELSFRERELATLPRPIIGIVPNGKPRVRLPNKVYPADQWAALAQLLRELPASVLQLGSRQDGPLLEGVLDYREIGYRHTGAVLRRCDLLVTHVSGIMHLTVAVGTPAVVLYGAAEHPAISGYPCNRNLYEPIECGPCWMEEPCSHHTCMRRLTPEMVMRSVRDALSER